VTKLSYRIWIFNECTTLEKVRDGIPERSSEVEGRPKLRGSWSQLSSMGSVEVAICSQSITSFRGFINRKDKNDPNLTVQLMFNLSTANATAQHQTQFLQTLEFIEFQDRNGSLS
jgi:hypothetical protein